MSRYNRLCKNKRRYGTKQLAIDVAKMSKDQNHPKSS